MFISRSRMVRPRPTAWRRLASLGCMIMALGACAHPTSPPTVETPSELSAPALTLLGYAYRLTRTSPAGREAAVRTARQQARSEPGAITYAYLAIALGSPHQHLYTPDEAARYARRALAAKPSPWDPDARQYLSDYARLYGALTRARGPSDADRRRIADLEKHLARAQAKLKALSNIEDHLDNAEDRP